ncbi:MAG: DNA repair protein RecN [Desulfosudaceae bacterium]
MLHELAIKNFAIIDDLRINLAEGLTILSGETGAGKSIIINAVNLLLGKRATARMIRTGEKTAEIEASFLIKKDGPAAASLQEHGYETGGELLIKRVISANNRHRVYINGSLATMQVLTEITPRLASISGQHAHQHLLKEEAHLATLDQFAGLVPRRENLRETYHRLLPLLREKQQLAGRQARQSEKIELLEFQKAEIDQAAVTPGEDEALQNEARRLKNARQLVALIYDSLEGLYDAQGSVIEQLARIENNLKEAGAIDTSLVPQQETVTDISARVEDAAGQLRSCLDLVQVDDQRLEQVEERLDLLIKIKKKYGPSLEEVTAFFDRIDTELAEMEQLSGRVEALDGEIARCHQELAAAARDLSDKRKKAAQSFEKKVIRELAGLNMPDTRFEILFSTTPAADNISPWLTVDGIIIEETGLDKAAFQIAPNVGETMKPLANIASGGELSRVVLALKAMLAGQEAVDTVIFDEVDAGIGGETAEVVGKKLRQLSRYHQTLCITHLPQIAKFADHHYKIEKSVSGGRTRTDIKPISGQEQIRELARMTGGEKITDKTLAHAEEMLSRASDT